MPDAVTPRTLTDYWRWYCAEFDRTRAAISDRDLERLYAELERVRQEGRQLFVLGNGGSAATAAHWVCDFGKGAAVPGQLRFRVHSCAGELPWLTALANDVSYDASLAEQLLNWIRSGDMVVALSVSGDSENLVQAGLVARRAQALFVAIVGARRGRLAELADFTLVLPSTDYGVVEDLHLTLNHAFTQFIRGDLVDRAEAALRDQTNGVRGQ